MWMLRCTHLEGSGNLSESALGTSQQVNFTVSSRAYHRHGFWSNIQDILGLSRECVRAWGRGGGGMGVAAPKAKKLVCKNPKP